MAPIQKNTSRTRQTASSPSTPNNSRRATTNSRRTTSVSGGHGGGRHSAPAKAKSGNYTGVIIAAAVLLILVVYVLSHSGKSATTVSKKIPAKAAVAKPAKVNDNAPPADWKGPPKFADLDDDDDNAAAQNNLSAEEVAKRIQEAKELCAQADAEKDNAKRNRIRKRVVTLCDEAANSRFASENDKKKANRLRWMAKKFQGVK